MRIGEPLIIPKKEPGRCAFVSAVLLLLLVAAGDTYATVTLAQVRTVCSTALEQGYVGLEAAACDWYLDPCDVCGEPIAEPLWCIPEALTATARTQRLLALIDNNTFDPAAPAAPLIKQMLMTEFPCNSTQYRRH